MDKVKKFLEGYVQWLAIALGVGFLGYTCYYYVLQKPVSVANLGLNSNVSPPDVDPMVMDGPGTQLKKALDNHDPAPIFPDPDKLVDDVPKLFEANPSDPSYALMSTPYLPLNPVRIEEIEDSGNTVHTEKLLVTKLPVAPSIVNLKVAGGHSNVPAPTVAAAGTPLPPVSGNAVSAVDKNWESVEGTIPVSVLSKAFDAARIPPKFRPTCILQVQLYREEKNPDGSWSDATLIPPLDINNQLKPFEGNKAPPAAQNEYKTWAESNVALICQPPFYQVLQGDVWYEPGTPNPNQITDVVIDDGFNPKDPGAYKGDPNKLTPPHRLIYDEYMAKKARLQNRPNNPQQNYNPGGYNPGGYNPGGYNPNGNGNGGNGNGGNGRGRGQGQPLADDPQRRGPGDDTMPPPRPYYPGGYPGGYSGPFGGPPGFMPPRGAQPGQTNTNAAQATLPQGSFDPAQQKDITVWAHDATAISGHTYRYMLKYIISNPVAHSSNLCNPQSLADQFSIESADSTWTDAVNVESDTSFYAVEVKGHGIHFDIFKWKNGVWQEQSVTATPGDMVGSVDSNGTNTNFTTGWTLVDVRDDPRDADNRIVVLVSDTGTIQTKEISHDANSSYYHHLLDEASKSKPTAAGGAPAGQNM